jgi:hypothetical protein
MSISCLQSKNGSKSLSSVRARRGRLAGHAGTRRGRVCSPFNLRKSAKSVDKPSDSSANSKMLVEYRLS